MTDSTVDRLGIPGLYDVHTHFLPPRVMAKVRAQFDSAGPMIGREWPLHYRGDEDELVADAGTPVVLHAGSGPVAGAHTGPGPVATLLRRHPGLTLVIAHLGAPEYAEFLELAEQHERVHLDTTMAFTDFFDQAEGAFPAALLSRLGALQEKVLLGSDFPNIPYPYRHQVEALERLELGDDWLRAVLWENAARLIGPQDRDRSSIENLPAE